VTPTQPHGFSVSATLRDGEISANSISELLQEHPPERLSDVSIHFWMEDRSIFLALSRWTNRLAVNGGDEGWILGRFEQLRIFFDARKVRSRPLLRRSLFWFNVLVLLPLTFYNLVTGFVTGHQARTLPPLATNVLSILVLAVFVALLTELFLPFSQVVLRPRKARLFTSTAVIVVFTVLGGIGGIGGFIVSLLALHK